MRRCVGLGQRGGVWAKARRREGAGMRRRGVAGAGVGRRGYASAVAREKLEHGGAAKSACVRSRWWTRGGVNSPF